MFGIKRQPVVPSFVEFHTNPSQERLREPSSSADLLVYPSWVEGYGMPPMEAMACRTGLVSTDVGVVRESASDAGVRLVPIRDAGAIVDAVETLLDEPAAIERMKAANHGAIRAYTWEVATDSRRS